MTDSNFNQQKFGEFSYNKAIRFKLEHECGQLPETAKAEFNITEFIENGLRIAKSFEHFIYVTDVNEKFKIDRSGERILSQFVSVKKQWLKSHFKNDFYSQNRIKQTEFELPKFEYIREPLKNWFKDWQNNLNELKEISGQSDHRKSRRSEIADIINKINSKNLFVFVREFNEYANHKSEYIKQQKLQDKINSFELQLLAGISEFLPSQTAGIVLAQGSMNYYTVNKKPKDYKKEIAELGKELDLLNKKYYERKIYKAEQKSNLYLLINQNKSKAEIKKECPLFADNDDHCLDEVIELTRQIERLNKKKENNNNLSKETREEISKLKQDRGFYFIKNRIRGKKHNYYFHNYCNYCEEYKRTALKRGQVIAKIKGIRREETESQNLKYWSLIFEKNNNKYLWLVHKDKMHEFKKELRNNQHGSCCLYVSHSLTMRALHKLCFAEESSFAADLPDFLSRKLSAAKKASNDQNVNQIKERKFHTPVKTKDELMLNFFKELMRSDYAHDILDLNNFDLTDLQQAETLNEFEALLEKACYDLEPVSISEDQSKFFINEYKVLTFKITSYDLEGRNKNTHQTNESDYKRYTREIWQEFWDKGNEAIRLNPEVKVRYREKKEETVSYLQKRGFDLLKDKNRFAHEQYTLNLTFTLNAGKKYPNLAFAKTEAICEEIDKFNLKFNQQNWESSYKYGIDRGEIELATLCITKFNKNETYEDNNGKTHLKPSFPEGEVDIKVYRLKKEWYTRKIKSGLENKPVEERREKRVIANLSYFIDKVENPDWFEKQSCTCIDLTTAKVINDKLILNGDILTYLKMKKEAAKRVLFELVAAGKLSSKISKLSWGEHFGATALIFPSLDEKSGEIIYNSKTDVIYFFEDEKAKDFEGLLVKDDTSYTKDGILENLQNYLNALIEEKEKQTGATNKHVPSVNKINHLRDALVANMVGVIFYLQKQYPGIVILEDLDKATISKHFADLNNSIERRLEWALIKKFQTLGKVPPHVKDIIEIREKARQQNKTKSSQLGALIFVDKENTSANCPYCEKKWDWKNKNALKFNEHRYVCGENHACGFDTKEITNNLAFLSEINDPDKVAAYNVAKKIEKYEDIEPLVLSKEKKKNTGKDNSDKRESRNSNQYKPPLQPKAAEIIKLEKLIEQLTKDSTKDVIKTLRQLREENITQKDIEQIAMKLKKRPDYMQKSFNSIVKGYLSFFEEIQKEKKE